MGRPFKDRAKFRRNLFRFFAISFVLSLIGAAVLFIPTLEFFVVDVIEKLGLPAGPIANFALLAEFVLAFIGMVGVFCIGIDWFFIAPRRR